MKNFTILAFFALFLSFGCQVEVKQEQKEDQHIVRQHIGENWANFIDSWEKEDAAACAGFFAENGINIPPNADILKGRKAIREFYEFLFSNNISSEYNHEIVSLDVLGNQAIEQANFQVRWMQNDSTKSVFNARSITHWKKDGGEWKIECFMFNQPAD